jgi:DNA mismatch repair protein MutL
VVELSEDSASRIIERASDLQELGLIVERFGVSALVVREIPADLGVIDVRGLIYDVADDLTMFDDILALRERLSSVYARFACHHSVRAGRTMSLEEMNHLLREMEVTPHSGQCSHGRPTYIQLQLNEIERLFGRR